MYSHLVTGDCLLSITYMVHIMVTKKVLSKDDIIRQRDELKNLLEVICSDMELALAALDRESPKINVAIDKIDRSLEEIKERLKP